MSSVVLGFALSFSFLFMSTATKLDSFWSFLIVSTAFIVGVSLGTSLSGDLLGINSSFSNALGGTLIGLIASFALLESAVFATDNPNNQVGKIYFNIMAVVALIVPSIFSVVFYNILKQNWFAVFQWAKAPLFKIETS